MKLTFLTNEVHKSILLWRQLEMGTERKRFWYVIAKLNFPYASLVDTVAFSPQAIFHQNWVEIFWLQNPCAWKCIPKYALPTGD